VEDQEFDKPLGKLHEYRVFFFDKDNPVFEVLNKEFISALGDYFSQRAAALGATKESPITVLEVGAGNGRLTHFLRKSLEEKCPGKINIIATDNGSWGLQERFPVEKISHKEALEKYNPKIVIFSWMPYEEDITNDFRSAKNVDEYILIGDSECCGDEWRTWGHDDGTHRGELAPYIVDGFDYEYLPEIGKHQLGRTDHNDLHNHSKTASFKRKK
jgi:hypothetical protein